MEEITTCKVCVKKVQDADDGLQCDAACRNWFHAKCVGLSRSEYSSYAINVNKKWHCTRMDCQTIASHPPSLILGKMDDLLSKFSLLASKEELSVITDSIQDINLI